MSLERKDVRFKLDPDDHAGLALVADVARVDIDDFVEDLVRREVRARIHDATVIAQRAARLGITGTARDCPGAPGKIRE